jgi:hypothetical protein
MNRIWLYFTSTIYFSQIRMGADFVEGFCCWWSTVVTSGGPKNLSKPGHAISLLNFSGTNKQHMKQNLLSSYSLPRNLTLTCIWLYVECFPSTRQYIDCGVPAKYRSTKHWYSKNWDIGQVSEQKALSKHKKLLKNIKTTLVKSEGHLPPSLDLTTSWSWSILSSVP